jgi:dipeptidase
LIPLASLLAAADGCTTLIAGRLATTDGSLLATQSDDGEQGADARAFAVPAADHAAGSKRNIYYDTEDFPRYIGYDRGPGYYPKAGQKAFPVMARIPQVNHTFAYTESTFGMMNEMQLGIGESTCSGMFGTKAIHDGGKAVFSIDTLSRLALERCATSRCAVKLMGDLAENHGGFYGAGSFEGTAESLMVIDGTEGFIFQILPDDTGTSAIWVAQRVPDDSVGVVSNMFTIRDVNLTCPPSGCGDATMLGSQNMYTIAEKQGWWKPADGALDFTKVSCCCCCRRCRRRCRCRRCCNSRCCNH